MLEDYVTIECARLLQQKGFPLEKVYKDNGERPLFYSLLKEHSDWSRCDAWYYPTLWTVRRWLREEMKLYVLATIYCFIQGEKETHAWGYEIINLESYESKAWNYDKFNHYETALQAGIMKALELIEINK